MTLEQIEYFVAAVEKGSFSAAGEAMFVSHSSVSRGVAVLEDELGVKLLVRGQRQFSCTKAGELFYRRSKAFLQQARALRECVIEFQDRQSLHLSSIGVYAPLFFKLCRDFQQMHPEVELVIQQEEQRAAVEKLRTGSVDMCLTFSYALPIDGNYDTLVLESGNFCAVVSPQHELANREYLTDEEIIERQDILGENPFHRNRERQKDRGRDVHSILLQIKTGNGITVLPEHSAAEFGQGCVKIPIRGGATDYKLMLVWESDNCSRALAEVVEFFRDRLSAGLQVNI